jgi:hypothetical protein
MKPGAFRMGNAHAELRRAKRGLGLTREQFRRAGETQTRKVLNDIKRHFLLDIDAPRWWEVFRYESFHAPLEVAHRFLEPLCPSEGKKVWLVPCAPGESEAVYEAEPGTLSELLAECAPFDYAVIDKRLQWLLLATLDHMVFAVGDPAIRHLRSVAAR